MSNQQQNDVNEGLSEKIFAGLDFILKSFQFNLFGNKEPKQVWKSIFTGEVTTSDMDGLLSHAFSNHVKILVALRESARAEMLAMQLLEHDAKNTGFKINIEASHTFHSLAEIKHNLLETIKAIRVPAKLKPKLPINNASNQIET